MKSNLVLLSTLLLAASAVAALNYPFSRAIVFPKDLLDVEYSPDQAYLLAIAKDYLQFYNGALGTALTHVELKGEVGFGSVAFSPDGQTIAIGYKNGSVILAHEQDSFNPAKGVLLDSNNTKPVKSLCFTADNRRMVFLTEGDNPEVFLYHLGEEEINETVISFSADRAHFVTCSPIRVEEFAVGGGDALQAKLVVYGYDLINHEINEKTTLKMEGSIFTSAVYSAQSPLIYITSENNVHTFDPYTNQTTSFDFDNNTLAAFTKIRVSRGGSLLAASSSQQVFVFTNLAPDDADDLFDDSIAQNLFDVEVGMEMGLDMDVDIYTTTLGSVALSPSGGNLLYVSSNSIGMMLSECSPNEFYNSSVGECQACSERCNSCTQSSSECLGCNAGFYLHKKACISCQDHCGKCLNPITCLQCSDTFTYEFGKCVCKEGTIQIDNLCASCPDHCSECDLKLNCKKCEFGFKIEKDDCIKEGGWPQWVLAIIAMLVVTLLCSICGTLLLT